MKNNTGPFVPFSHENLELKNALVSQARSLRQDEKTESQLASAMIYVSISEYLAEHLLENLKYFIYRSTYIDFAGILFIDERGASSRQTFGDSIKSLNKYNFPDKSEIISMLQEINKCRNHLFHNLAKASENDLAKIAIEITTICEKSEEFIEKINVVYAGLQRILIPASESSTEENEKK